MKKLLFFLAALMFVASCAKDTTTTPVIKGEKVVSFKITSPKMQTRYGEGAEANKLFWAVYKDGQRLDNVSVIDPAEAVAINMSVDVEITLMEGIDYDILFWAQNEDAPYTFDGAKVTIDYDALSANEEIYDAFFRNYHVDADQTEPHRVELRRPFAQLNIGTADTTKAQSAGFTVEKTSITVETCTVLDLATGEASEPQEITFEMNTKASDTYGEAPDTFDIISMNYLLVNNDKVMTTVTFNAEGGNDTIEREYLNVSLQRNHRTYILGDILTSSKLFNVYINPAFEDEDLFPEWTIYYTTANGRIFIPNTKDGFGANIISNTYENGIGKITFDGSVTKIGVEAFAEYEESRLTSITLPEGITEIGDQAFWGCRNLTSFTIPDSVKKIGVYSFNCLKLTSITIPDNVIEIGDAAFSSCSNLTEIHSRWASEDNRCLIVDGTLNSFAPAGLTTYTIPGGVTKIGNSSFQSCEELTKIIIPDSVTEIGDSAFNACGIESITIPSGITEIGSGAFAGCYGLTEVIIPDNVVTIGTAVFSDCDNLTYVTLGNSVTEIGMHTFYNCTKLTDITLPDSVTKIGSWAFHNCQALTNITIPNSVTDIEECIFSNCSGIVAFYGKWASEDNRYLNVNGTLNSFASAGLTTYSIPNDVEIIGESAFSNCQELTSITIPDSVTQIGDDAFDGCTNLSEIIIGTNVISIGNRAFGYCEKLTSITIPENVTYIGYGAFSSCENISTIYCKPTTPPTPGYGYGSVWDAFSENAPDLKIYVPTESVDAYKNADGWKEYADYIVDGEF